MNDKIVDLGIRGHTAHLGDHIAYFWESEEEFTEALGFLETGLRGGDYCVIFGHPEANEKVAAVLSTHGFAKELVGPRIALLGGKGISNETFEEIGVTFRRALEAGALLIRFLGNIGWRNPEWSIGDDMLQFGSKVCSAYRNVPCVVVCMYDVKTLNERSGIGSFEQNPHFVPAAQYLARYLKRDS